MRLGRSRTEDGDEDPDEEEAVDDGVGGVGGTPTRRHFLLRDRNKNSQFGRRLMKPLLVTC